MLRIPCFFFKAASIILVAAFLQCPALPSLGAAASPEFQDDTSRASLKQAVRRSLSYLQQRPQSRRYNFGTRSFSTAELAASMEVFLNFLNRNPGEKELSRLISKNFVALQARDARDRNPERSMIVTGYYEPVLAASLVRTREFTYPLLMIPPDLALRKTGGGDIKIGRMTTAGLVPYWTRAEIERREWPTSHVLAWVRDPVDAFFLQVQGSGRIQLRDGSLRGIHYHLNNGHPYRSIGRFMVDTGRIGLKEAGLFSIKKYLRRHPGERAVILSHNQSFIFFRWEERDAAIGNIEVALTPGRSIAVDQSIFPPGSLAYLQTRQPVFKNGKLVSWRPLSRFVLAQDSGSAIKGAGRVDLFWGRGSKAGQLAGSMKEKGSLHLLIHRRFLTKNPAIRLAGKRK